MGIGLTKSAATLYQGAGFVIPAHIPAKPAAGLDPVVAAGSPARICANL